MDVVEEHRHGTLANQIADDPAQPFEHPEAGRFLVGGGAPGGDRRASGQR